MNIHVGRYPGSPFPPTSAYLTQNYEPTRTASGATIQRQPPWGDDAAHAGEYRVTSADGSDLGWQPNFASAMAAVG